jgi:hypothetical protein
LEGATTFRPGTWAKIASKLSECWAAAERIVPSAQRSTIGTFACPPNM